MPDHQSSSNTPDTQSLSNRNRKTGLTILAIVIGMIALAYASVPLYNIFCRVTGFGGTTQVAANTTGEVLERMMNVKFTGNTERNMPWAFRPDIREVDVKVGAKKLISYSAKNMASIPITGTAVFNVTPAKAGKYFNKIECFCFTEQILQPDEKVNMPVVFFIDPAIMNDRTMDDVKTITLSYSFFKTESQELDKAMEDFYNEPIN
jgi:cytochrome c oxidase assembly protein subunit 11